MLDDTLKAQVAGALLRLVHPIDLVVATDDSDAGAQVRALVADLAPLSPRMSVRAVVDAPRRPALGLARAGEAPRNWFVGAPLGHEFTSLVLSMLWVGGVSPKVEPAVLDAIRALPGPLAFETFVSLSCHNCPEVVQALNLIAAVHPGASSVVIDGAVVPDEVEARKIMGVPAVFRDGALISSGRATLDELLAKLGAAAKVEERAPYDVLIVGGGPAGASAAVYAARKGVRVGLVAERFGGQVADTLGIENLIAVAHTEGPQLVAQLQQRVREHEVDLITGQRVAGLSPSTEPDGLHGVALDGGPTLRARTVILAPGARWREMGVPGEAELKTRGVAFCPHCDGPLFKGRDVAVIGGGNSGVEAAIDLAGITRHVTVLEFADALRADAVLQRKLRSLPNVDVHLNAQTTAVAGEQKVDGLTWRDRRTGEDHRLDVEGIFVQIGLFPSTDFLKGAVAMTPRGEIEVDAAGRTSVPGIFAAGDATTTPYKQIVVALGDGAKAALSAFEHLVRTSGAALAA